jgi:hypothetical protein
MNSDEPSGTEVTRGYLKVTEINSNQLTQYWVFDFLGKNGRELSLYSAVEGIGGRTLKKACMWERLDPVYAWVAKNAAIAPESVAIGTRDRLVSGKALPAPNECVPGFREMKGDLKKSAREDCITRVLNFTLIARANTEHFHRVARRHCSPVVISLRINPTRTPTHLTVQNVSFSNPKPQQISEYPWIEVIEVPTCRIDDKPSNSTGRRAPG